MLCPKCQKWEIGKQDVYCSWCCWKLVDFNVSLNAKYLYVNQLSSGLKLTIAHTGPVGAIRFDKSDIQVSKAWLKVETDSHPTLTLRQGSVIELPVEIDTDGLPDDYHEAKITVNSFVGSRSAKIEIVPAPEIQSSLGDHIVHLDDEGADVVSGFLTASRGVAEVTEITTDLSNISGTKMELDDQAAYPYPLDARSGNRLNFKLVFDHQQLLDQVGGDLPAERNGQIRVKYTGTDFPRTYSFRVKFLRPPKLALPDETGVMFKLPLFTGKPGNLDLTLQNGKPGEKGRADLRILEIKVESPHLRLSEALQSPLIIRGGQSQSVRFTAIAHDLSNDRHVAKISFLTDQPGAARRKDVFVEINVKEMLDYDGWVAIDFGTVNSCCAFVDDKGATRLIEIDLPENNERPTTAPSTILYRNKLESGARDYEIGQKPYKFSFDPILAASAVRQIKRYLGSSERVTITYRDDRSRQDHLLPREITADILKRILERAEEQVKGRIRKCAVAHPSRFSIKQIEDLKAALTSCGVEEIETMHEPLGGAFDYIQRHTVAGQTMEYHLMVYDFGGGTTDISLLRVTARHDPETDQTDATPTVLGVTGNRWMGGEDVTDLVMQIVQEKIDRLAPEHFPNDPVEFPISSDNLRDPFHANSARSNQFKLREFAEEVKISISEHGDQPLHGDLFLNLIKGGEVIENVVFNRQNIAPLESEMNERLRPLLLDMVEMMRHLADNSGVPSPDVIVLSGKSSALPIVRQVIEEVFPQSKIYTPSDPKECVVKGACQLFHHLPESGVSINIEQSECLSATTSYLGIQVRQHGQASFRKLIDAGVPIPPEGLRARVKGVALKRENRITLLENTSLRNELEIDGKANPNISEVDTFRLDKRLRELEEANGMEITKEALRKAKIELEITPNLGVRLIATIPGVEQPVEFETELRGW